MLLRTRYIGQNARYTSQIAKFGASSRTYASQKVDPQKAAEEKREAAKLALQSLKDVGLMFSSSSNDEATQPIDTKAIFEDPSLFGSLSLLHQGQVLQELQEKYDKKWAKLTEQDKKLGYYISYGSWGVREDFNNWNTLEAPYDLPFHVPSKISTVEPTPKTTVKKAEPVFLAETKVRKAQFDLKKMDPVTKVFIYLTVLIAIVAIARDKKIGESGKPVEVTVEDPYEAERALRQERAHQEEVQRRVQEALEAERRRRKWYYLYLK